MYMKAKIKENKKLSNIQLSKKYIDERIEIFEINISNDSIGN